MIFIPSGGCSKQTLRKIKLATVKCGDEMWSEMGPSSDWLWRTSISRPEGRSPGAAGLAMR